MPTIKARRQANGITRYTAIVRIRRGGAILHRESRTFTHRSAALSWAKHREVALEDPSALTRVQHGAPTIADLIRWYIETFETISKWQRSKQTHLEFLERHSLGKTNALKLTSAALIDHVRSRRADGAGPATVANDLVGALLLEQNDEWQLQRRYMALEPLRALVDNQPARLSAVVN
jgi:hypothetical protein